MLANCLEHVKWKIANTNGEVKVNTTSEAVIPSPGYGNRYAHRH